MVVARATLVVQSLESYQSREVNAPLQFLNFHVNGDTCTHIAELIAEVIMHLICDKITY